MSWSFNKMGRAGKLASIVKQQIVEVQGCPKGSAEEAAKNQVGDVLETLCKSLPSEKVITISCAGSAWNQSDGTALSQSLRIELNTIGDFLE
jgi:hypothetical protein